MFDYDVTIIGGGPAGFAAAMRAVNLGKRTLLIEKNELGGYSIYNGALSTKTLWEISLRFVLSSGSNNGFFSKESTPDFHSIWAQKKAATFEKTERLQKQIDYLVNHHYLTFKKGAASLVDKHTIQVNSETFSSQFIILATGSRPRQLPNIQVDEKHIFTSDGIENIEDFPTSLVILGAGVIGCEYATIFSNFGKTRVSLIDKQDQILPFEDDDIVSHVRQNFEQRGVRIHHHSSLIRMEVIDGLVEYEIQLNNGQTEIHRVEKALISVGRVPNLEHIGLENAGVELDERGYILDNDCRTSVSNIFAVGDITADVALVNVAELEGRHAVEKAFGMDVQCISYNNISSIMFLRPEVAAVGLNEKQAKAKKIPYRVAIIDYKLVSRAIAMRRTNGLFKVLVSDDEKMSILGMRVVGPHASSTIQAVSVLIHLQQGVRAIAETVHAHPSMPEGIQECARVLLGTSVLNTDMLGPLVQCFRVDSHGRHTELNQISPNKNILKI